MPRSSRYSQPQGFISANLQAHIDQVLAAPRMSRREERTLMCRWKKRDDDEARDRIVESHMRFVVAIALGYRNYPISMDDLISEGSMGLMVALTKFDPSRGTRFVTYASFWIRAYILDLIIRSWHSGKHGSGPFTSKVFFKLRRERARLYSRFGDQRAGRRELARCMGLSEDSLQGMLDMIDAAEVSLDQPLTGEQGVTMKELIVDSRRGPEEETAALEVRARIGRLVRQALETLDERERYVIRERMLAPRRRTLAKIGRELGVSRERARQLEARARRKLRERLGGEYRHVIEEA